MSTSTSMIATDNLPACLARDNLTSRYFPSTSAATLRAIIALCTIFATTSFCRVDPALWGQFQAGSIVRRALGTEGLALSQSLLATLIGGVLILGMRFWLARRETQTPKPAEATAMRTVIAMGIVFMTALVSPPSYALLSGQPRGEAQILPRGTPLYLGDEVARRGISGNLAAPSDWADYLVGKSDGRLLPVAPSSDCQAVFAGDPAWLDLLASHHARYLAASRQRHPQLVRLVTAESRSRNSRLRIVYQDQSCILAEIANPQTPR